MKLAILLIATLIGVLNARMVAEKPGQLTGKLETNKDCFHCEEETKTEWYTSGVFYQVYPKSFRSIIGNKDEYGVVGDLQGVREKLPHLKDLGVDGLWLSPVFKSPQKDGGYDISDFKEVDPMFGTIEDMKMLVTEAKRLGIKLILDFVPNHTSDQHVWFQNSINDTGYQDYYVWHEGKCSPTPTTAEPTTTPPTPSPAPTSPPTEPSTQSSAPTAPGIRADPPCAPPNNWVSVFGGSAWEWNEKRQKYYLHQFDKGQPDLNFRNPAVKKELLDVLEFWMDIGIDGFRVDAINHAFEDIQLRDEFKPGGNEESENWDDIYHEHTKDQPESFELVYDWRDFMDYYAYTKGLEPKIMMTEAYPLVVENSFKWFGDKANNRLGSQMPFNFIFISDLDKNSKANDFVDLIQSWYDNVPEYAQPNWVLGNHDRSRVGSRYGVELAEALAVVEMTLPGIAVIYNGEEIGMVDHRKISWEDTQDPQACNNPQEPGWEERSRDPVRTPFQWNGERNTGFSNTTEKLFLPVHPDYTKNNLKLQKEADKSTYKLYQNLIKLRKLPVFRKGELKIKAFDENAFGYLRHIGLDEVYAVAINLKEEETEINFIEAFDEAIKDSGITKAQFVVATNNYENELLNEETPHPTLEANKIMLGGHQAVVVRLFSPTNGATGITISLTLLCAAILRVFF